MANHENINNMHGTLHHIPGESILEEYHQALSAGAALVFLTSHRSMEQHCQCINTTNSIITWRLFSDLVPQSYSRLDCISQKPLAFVQQTYRPATLPVTQQQC